MEATHRTATAKCETCGQDFDPEVDDNCRWIEIEDEAGEVTGEAIQCGTCAPPYTPPTGHYELRDGRLGWFEDGVWTARYLKDGHWYPA